MVPKGLILLTLSSPNFSLSATMRLKFLLFFPIANVSMLKHQTKMVSMENIMAAKHQHSTSMKLKALLCPSASSQSR